MALVSGMDAPKGGKYVIVGPRGGKGNTVTIPRRGTTMPPTPKSGSRFNKK